MACIGKNVSGLPCYLAESMYLVHIYKIICFKDEYDDIMWAVKTNKTFLEG